MVVCAWGDARLLIGASLSGMPLGMAPAAHVLYSKFLRVSHADPTWPNRDRFVLSNGHGIVNDHAPEGPECLIIRTQDAHCCIPCCI